MVSQFIKPRLATTGFFEELYVCGAHRVLYFRQKHGVPVHRIKQKALRWLSANMPTWDHCLHRPLEVPTVL